MKISRSIMIALFILMSVSVVYAAPSWKDTCERYPTGAYTDYWTLSGGGFSASVIQTPGTYPSAHALKIQGTTVFTYTTLSTKDFVYDNYISFTSRSIYADKTYFQYEIRLTNEAGQTVASKTITYDGANVGTEVYEIVSSGNDIYLYKNGVSQGAINTASYAAGQKCRLNLVYFLNTGVSGWTCYQILDDISTGSCIGISTYWNEYQTTLETSYRIEGLLQHPNYNYYIRLTSLTADNAGIINETEISNTTYAAFTTWPLSSTLGENYGLYYAALMRDDIELDGEYFVYSLSTDPIDYPELLLYATSNADMEIRDADNNGGIISSGGSVYLYPDNASGIYPIRYTLQGTPYSFTASLNAVYGNSLINSTPFTFGGLSNNYVVTLDGESLAGTHASGNLVFADNVTDGETVTIGSDVYEFESTGGVTGGNIQVNIGNVTQTAENLTTAINTAGLSAVSASVVETPASYYSNIEITNNPGIVDYQAKVTIPFETGMSADFSNIRFFDSGVSIPYWVESKTDSDSTVVWIPISAGSDIQCRWGISEETTSASTPSIFDFYDDFSTDTLSNYTEIYYANWGAAGIKEITGGKLHFGDNLGGSSSSFLYSNTELPPGSYVINAGFDANGYDTSYRQQKEIGLGTVTAPTYVATGTAEIQFSGFSSVGIAMPNDTGQTANGDTGSAVYTSVSNRHPGVWVQDCMSDTVSEIYIDYLYVRKYAATEPTLSVGAAQVSTESAQVTSVHIVSDSIGVASNSITTTETCTNAAFGAETLTGGSGGSVVNTPTWSYEITDWTNLTTHIFSFSPDLSVPGVYGYVKDVSTQAAIQSATVTVVGPNSTQYVYTDENGFYYLTNGMELNEQYTVSAAKSGYTQGVSFTVSTTAGATTRKDLLLDSLGSTDGVYYANHYVKLVVVDKSWHKLNATMTVSSANGTLCTNEVLGTDGALTLKMTEDIKYTIKTTYNGATQTDYITPADTIYYIIWDAASATLVPEQFYEYVSIDIAKEIVSPTEAYINITYADGKTNTNSVNFVLGQYAENGTLIVLQTSPTFTANCTTGFTVNDYTGETYVIKANINHGTFGTITKYYSIAFTGSNLPFTGKALAYFGIFILFIVAFQFGKAEHASGAIMLCGVCWLFWYVGIFEAFGTTINTTMSVGLSLATIYSLATYINEKRREEGV